VLWSEPEFRQHGHAEEAAADADREHGDDHDEHCLGDDQPAVGRGEQVSELDAHQRVDHAGGRDHEQRDRGNRAMTSESEAHPGVPAQCVQHDRGEPAHPEGRADEVQDQGVRRHVVCARGRGVPGRGDRQER
jgi:hypothetical protein